MKVAIINGPNLNLLGTRQVEVYGQESFETYFINLQKKYPFVGLSYYQSNIEGKLINKLHKIGFEYDAIILNAGAYTHTSIALADAIQAIETPVTEVHISNVFKRESFRHESKTAPYCKGSIIGFGLMGYELALIQILSERL